jgi:hypothetical protein
MLTLFFSDFLDPGRLAEIFAQQRAVHVATLSRYQQVQADLGAEGAVAATLRFGITYEQALIAWIDSNADLASPK